MISPGIFFIVLKFSFFGLLGGGGKRAKNSTMKNNNYICHSPYLRNSKPYDHDFWYTCVKWWYLQVFLSFYWNFDFWGPIRGVKGKSRAQNKNNNYILHGPYLWNSIMDYHGFWYTCVQWWCLQEFFSFWIFSFFGLLGG